MVKESKKIPHIELIFETKNGLLTENAWLYQDILQYQLEANKTKTGFEVYEDLAKYLFNKNIEFKNEYSDSKAKTSMNNRFANHRDRILGKIKDLLALGLLAQKGITHARKVKAQPMPLYALTENGYVLAQILRREKMKGKFKSAINQTIIQFVVSWLRRRNSSMAIFASTMYELYQKEGLIDIPLDMIKDYLFSGKAVGLIFQLVISIVNTSPTNHKHLETHWKIVYEALLSLDASVLKSVLFQLKQTYEQQILNTHPDLTWEDYWLENIADENTLTLWGKCRKCNQVYHIAYDIREYLKIKIVMDGYPVIHCQKCKEKYSVVAAPVFTT